MKKMMMAVAVVLAAVVVNAANINWSTGNLSALSGTYATTWQGQTAYFFLVGSAGYDESTVIAALQAGGSGALVTGNADASGALKGNPSYGVTVAGTTAFVDGNTAYGYAVVFDVAGDKFGISKVGTSAIFASGANAALAEGGTANFTVYTVVPEPTSMALLALGAAALGLRRRFKK